MIDFRISRPSKAVCLVEWDAKGPEDSKRSFLLRSDAHHDNVHTVQALERHHLDQARQIGAGILDGGDLHCAMEGKWDRRKDRSSLRPEYADPNGEYLDLLVNHAGDFYRPYAENWITMSRGNHEQAIRDHHETCLTERTAEKLRAAGSPVQTMPYSHWVVLKCNVGSRQTVRTLKIKVHHGYGGGGVVTKGMIQTNRMAVYLPDADIVWSGHIHEQWVMWMSRERVTVGWNTQLDEQAHVRTATYKEEYLDGSSWHSRGGRPPKPLGAWWLDVWFANETVLNPNAKVLRYEFRRAGLP